MKHYKILHSRSQFGKIIKGEIRKFPDDVGELLVSKGLAELAKAPKKETTKRKGTKNEDSD